MHLRVKTTFPPLSSVNESSNIFAVIALPFVTPSVFLCRYLVNLGCIKPLCDLLTVMDSKIVQVALNGLENILRLGEQEAKQNCSGLNPYCSLIEEAYGNVFSLALNTW